jgi:cysteine-rich repeat protein
MVTKKETNVTVKTSDGKGGCPAGAQTYVRVYDSNNAVYAQFNGATGCADLTPNTAPGLGNLAPGLYYVHVESAALAIIPEYVLDIAVATPACGDGVVQVETGEQCDHGATNGMPSDGCSATCQILSGSFVSETEPNDASSMANSLAGYAGAVGEIYPLGDVDVYAVAVTVAGSSIDARVGDGFGGCPLGFDSKLSLLSPSGATLVADAGGGVSPCSLISPSQYVQATNLAVGTYYLQVQRVSAATQQYYVLGVTLTPPSCGDGIVEIGEQCDPGPAMVAGCSATCQLTGDFIPETEPNDTQATANPLGTHAGFVASIQSAGDVDFFSFAVPGPSSSVFLQTSDGIGGCPLGFDSTLTLFGPSHQMILQDDNGGVNLCSKITPALYPQASKLPAGTYYAEVQFKGGTSVQPLYVMTISVAQSGCGDGILQAGEQCDDGPLNGTPGDGCSAACVSLPPWEIEPNGTTATATPAWPGYTSWNGAITPVADHDYYSFTLATKGTVTLTTHDKNRPTYCSSDTFLTLLDMGGSLVKTDDDSGPGPGYPNWGKCSKISAVPLNAGTYYAMVQCASDLRVIPEYQLDLLVQ